MRMPPIYQDWRHCIYPLSFIAQHTFQHSRRSVPFIHFVYHTVRIYKGGHWGQCLWAPRSGNPRCKCATCKCGLSHYHISGTIGTQCRVAFLLIRILFIYDSHFLYFLDKCLVLNKILEPAIFIFKN